MTDLDELRRALRAQETLAPDPDEVLAGATRRIRRRRVIGVAAVTFAVVALGAGAVGALERGTAVVPPAAHPSPSSAAATGSPDTGKVPPAAPAVSLEDSSWQLMFWAIQPHFATVHYGQDHKYAFEIEVRESAPPKSALPAKPTTAGQISQPQTVMWQDGPNRWFRVQTAKPVTAAEMLDLLGKIRATPPVIKSPLKSVQLPAGQKVDTFTSESEANTLVLCPDIEVRKVPLDSRCFSLFVWIPRNNESSDSGTEQDPLPARQFRKIGPYTVEINSSPANRAAALTLLNSVQLDR
ncbi:hypothetical protein [Amycolatopsis mediterranei]|nr:hypothetical protein [Amycolatopsis mediterranei]AEK44839.1 hypothetical protein RAM_31830 [Amycolatopsis mediterranei S699]KDO10760.1 hypothetical protein DV26_11080 [Amycolatopsis mediterranei]KDU87237.1 hypothetical protein DV36_36830 [Amycolatopsis mediterranei]UZF72951.1 hypothetical protein ISP_006350 [Amycolatopsis mediterranei]